MQFNRGTEFLELGRTLSRSRSTSMSSDSQISRIHLLTPPPVNPPPSFIASTAASQIITADQEFNTADFVADENDGTTASAIVTPQALYALNAFLDHLLFNILATAKSTQLASIRPALAEVLKPRLAKEVVSAADEELSEYMGGPEDEQFEFGGNPPQNSEFDLIRSWKLTRLRCMVYTRLGDMEEDDEEEFIAEDGLVDDTQRFSSHVGNITPAAAIFLTSIFEHIGEQALVIAGETARSRLSAKFGAEVDTDSGAERATMDRLVVEDLDMEKLALNPTLGRLWRTWRKRIRNPNLARAISRESIMRRGTTGGYSISQKSSINAIDELLSSAVGTPATETPPTEIDPTSVPLPIGDHDVEEIENPAFHDMDGAEIVQTMEAVVAHKVRPHSLMVLTLPSPRSAPSGGSTPSPITPISAHGSRPTRHARSRSLPNAAYAPDAPEATEAAEAAVEPNAPTTPEDEQIPERPSPTSEERKQLETMYEHEEDDEPVVECTAVAVSPVKVKHMDQSAELSSTESMETAPTSLSGASVEVVTSQASSVREPSTSWSERVHTDNGVEVIEGHGTVEKPKLTTVQRPKRKSSRQAPNTDLTEQDEVDDELPMQGVPCVSVQHSIKSDVAQGADRDATAERQAPHPQPSADAALPEESKSRPVSTSDESGRSGRSRTRPKPSPLPLSPSGSQQYGRASPGLSSASSATERAGVQRLSGKATTSVASSSYSKSRRSDSFSSIREKRPVTAGSTTSQVSTKLKGLMTRPPETASLRLRSSSETSRVSANTGDSVYDDKSGLDELIRSEQTIHYTLTPKSMREMEHPDSPRWRTNRSHTADLADFLKNTSPPGEPTSRPRTANNSSRAPIDSAQSPAKPKYTPIQIGGTGQQQKSSTAQTHDVKPSVGSTRDFASFMKPSTQTTSTNGQSGSSKTSRFRRFSDAAELSKKFTRPTSTVASTPRYTGPRPQARPAAIPREDSAELIDFIREGPPSAGARIPRNVAPFRDTLDSDDLDSLDHASTVTSTRDGSMAKSMVSNGSRTGLLESTSRASMQGSGPVPTSKPPPVSASTGPPARKQRRVPDPYAIDMDDELDDDELEELLEGPKPKREEESLMDFLRNVPPPASEAAPPRPFSVNTAPKGATGGIPGTSSIKARLLRSTSAEKTPTSKPSRSSLRQSPETQTPSSNYTVKAGTERARAPLRPSPSMPSVSERQTETSALADFLKNTGPPDPVPTRPTPITKSNMLDTNNITRLFTRRKKVEA